MQSGSVSLATRSSLLRFYILAFCLSLASFPLTACRSTVSKSHCPTGLPARKIHQTLFIAKLGISFELMSLWSPQVFHTNLSVQVERPCNGCVAAKAANALAESHVLLPAKHTIEAFSRRHTLFPIHVLCLRFPRAALL